MVITGLDLISMITTLLAPNTNASMPVMRTVEAPSIAALMTTDDRANMVMTVNERRSVDIVTKMSVTMRRAGIVMMVIADKNVIVTIGIGTETGTENVNVNGIEIGTVSVTETELETETEIGNETGNETGNGISRHIRKMREEQRLSDDWMSFDELVIIKTSEIRTTTR